MKNFLAGLNWRNWLISFIGLILSLCAVPVKAQTSVALLPPSHQQFFTPSGAPNAGGCVFFFNSGTSTPAPTYTDVGGSILQTNPVILDSTGSSTIYLGNQSYRVQVWTTGGVNCSLGNMLWQQDGVNAFQILDTAQTIIFQGVTSFPVGQPGEMLYRSDLARLCFFYTVWDCIAGLNTVDNFTNKSIDVTANTIYNDFSNIPGDYLRNNGVRYVDSPIQSTDLQGLAPVFSCISFTISAGAQICSVTGTGTSVLTTSSGLVSGSPAGTPACFTAGAQITNIGCQVGTVYNTGLFENAASVPITTMATAPANDQNYLFTVYVQQSGATTGCSPQPSAVVQLTFTDAVRVIPITISVQMTETTFALAQSATMTFGSALGAGTGWYGNVNFRAKASTAVQYAVAYSPGTGCSVGATYFTAPNLTQQ